MYNVDSKPLLVRLERIGTVLAADLALTGLLLCRNADLINKNLGNIDHFTVMSQIPVLSDYGVHILMHARKVL